MAMTVDWPNKIISVPQGDLTLISGTLYEMDTETYFRANLMALADDEQGMPWPYPLSHNSEVTVAGTTFARTIELINGYQVQFTPDTQWTVRLVGSNNNLFDVENNVLIQNQVQVIPGNSAGLQTVVQGSGLDSGQDTKLTEIHTQLDTIENGMNHQEVMRCLLSAMSGILSGSVTTGQPHTLYFRDQLDSKNRMVVTVDGQGNRTAIVIDSD